MLRTHTCGELRAENAGETVVLCGWVASRRDHGGVLFLDLRDRYGITQVFVPSESADVAAQAEAIGHEWVIRVEGTVTARPEGMRNKNRLTGAVEVEALSVEVLNRARPPAIPVNDEETVSDEQRLRHRYLDLRRPASLRMLEGRHAMIAAVRRYFDGLDFVDVETPSLVRWTPGGARNYVVPSRVHHGTFYALAESPQLFKQLLMVSGLDRYYQIVRCFRDEDLRVDRQPEFSQVDVEMSFVEEEDILSLIEGMLQVVLKEVRGVEVDLPLPRLSYAEALSRYGSDKPDLRYGLEIAEVSTLAATSGFGVFKGAVDGGGVVRGLAVPGGATLSRKQIDGLERVAKDHGARGLAWIKVGEPGTDEAFKGPPVKFLGDGEAAGLAEACGGNAGDLLLFGAGEPAMVAASLGAVRAAAARVLELVDAAALAPCWVVDFPMFEQNSDGSWAALHHAFTSPREEDLGLLESDPGAVRARAYDLVLNGFEIGGGSIRTHRVEIQERVFRAMGIGEEEAMEKFSWLLDALASGAPPHGGIALGVDRMAMVLLRLPGIRDAIAFPKTTSAQDLLTGAPGTISEAQLVELGVAVRPLERD